MTKKFVLVIALAFVLFNLAKTEEKGQKHFLWEVKSLNSTVYLLGSIHLAKAEAYPLADIIEKSFSSCDNLIVEANTDNIDPFKILKLAMYQDTNTLEKNVDSSIFNKISSYFEKHKIGKEVFKKYKPWFAVFSILELELSKAGFSNEFGIDVHFMNEAKEKGKRILELEGVDKQIELLDTGMQKFSKDFLDFSLLDIQESALQVDSLFQIWNTGDAAAFEKYSLGQEEAKVEYKDLMNLMLYDRNIEMTKKIEKYLESGSKYFLVVGSGHLVGEKGILARLEKEKKYLIKQL